MLRASDNMRVFGLSIAVVSLLSQAPTWAIGDSGGIKGIGAQQNSTNNQNTGVRELKWLPKVIYNAAYQGIMINQPGQPIVVPMVTKLPNKPPTYTNVTIVPQATHPLPKKPPMSEEYSAESHEIMWHR